MKGSGFHPPPRVLIPKSELQNPLVYCRLVQLKRAIQITAAVLVACSILVIFIHPAVDGPAASQHRTQVRVLFAAMLLATSLLLAALTIEGTLSRTAPVPFSVTQKLALHCTWLC